MNVTRLLVNGKLWRLVKDLLHYAYAAIGPVGSAVAQFLLSLLLLHGVSRADFGAFSFLLVASNFSIGIWSALFCAPLPVLLGKATSQSRKDIMTCLHSTGLLMSVAAALVFFLVGAAIGSFWMDSAFFALYAGMNLVRWFARADAYTRGEAWRTVVSDNVYAVLLAAFVLTAYSFGTVTLTTSYAALLVSVVLALIPFGRQYARAQFLDISISSMRRYRDIWREHSGWSLLGVVTTEATANANAYLVVWMAGSASFASISASALLMRPTTVLMNALGDFERPRISRKLEGEDLRAALSSVSSFRVALGGAWLATALAAAVLLVVAPHIIFPPEYPLAYLVKGTALWMLVAAVRMLRLPESILMQSGGVFRELAFASVVSSGFSVASVIVLLLFVDPLWSIAGILLGEIVFAIWIWRQARRWLKTKFPAPPVSA